MTDRPDLVAQAIIEYLKASTTVLAELPDDNEIREEQWQGTGFTYPNIRVHIVNLGNYDVACSQSPLEVRVQVYSEEPFSSQANRIAGIIKTVLHDKPFIRNGLQISLRATIIPAIRSDDRTWRSEVLLRGVVSG